MLNLRPRLSPHYLERPRLLARLPDTPGRVVWLEAPFGYGKSVLAAQWASRLEEGGLRVVWLSLALGLEVRKALAQALGLPPGVPWGAVLEALAEGPSLVVLEDLEARELAPEQLGPLLRYPQGLVLLASRTPLPYPELPELLSGGRLTHLRAQDLAFTLEEALRLFPDPATAERAHRTMGGWPLVLHLMALTGEPPAREALWQGARQSLGPALLQEALLLAALPYLPKRLAWPETEALAARGFAQALAEGYRLHPLVAETLLDLDLEGVWQAVRRAGERLDPLLRGYAYERVGLWEELAQLLEAPLPRGYLPTLDPAAFLRWDGRLGGRRGPRRALRLGEALCRLGRVEEGVALLGEVGRCGEAEARTRLEALGVAAYFLTPLDPAQARAVAEAGEALLEGSGVDPDQAGRFLNDIGFVYEALGDRRRALALLERATQLLQDSPARPAPRMNLAYLRFETEGDLEGMIRVYEEELPALAHHLPQALAEAHLTLARAYRLLSQEEDALAHLEAALREAPRDAPRALEAEAERAALLRDLEASPPLLGRARSWGLAAVEDRILALWARALREGGGNEAALRVLGPGVGFWSGLERALALGDPRLLPPRPKEREALLFYLAARFQLLGEEGDLEALLALTSAGARILPSLLPLEALPPGRPEAFRFYPLGSLLRLGPKEAIRARIAEVPPFEGAGSRGLPGGGTFRGGPAFPQAPAAPGPAPFGLLGGKGPGRPLARGRSRASPKQPPGPPPPPAAGAGALEGARLPEGGRLVHVEADLHRLDALLRRVEAREGGEEEVLALYREPLFPEVDLPEVDEEREALRALVVRAFTGLAHRLAPEAALPYLERALELDPLKEEAFRQLFRALAALGRTPRPFGATRPSRSSSGRRWAPGPPRRRRPWSDPSPVPGPRVGAERPRPGWAPRGGVPGPPGRRRWESVVRNGVLRLGLGFLALLGLPCRASEGVFYASGLRLHYLEAGRGEPVVLLHGWAVDSGMWSRVVPLLAQEFRVIALDCRGHGGSAKPHDPGAYGPEMARDALRLLDRLGLPRAHLVGYSMGALLLGQVLAEHPERALSAVFAGGAPVVEWDPEDLTAQEVFLEGWAGSGLFPWVALALALRSLRELQVSPEALEAYRGPVLFAYGSEVWPSTRRYVARARAVWPQAEEVVLRGADHFTTPSRPEFAEAVLAFLRRARQGALPEEGAR
jgi:pimeloyl-ACP methyl ester carboxylesterase/tetratricopeptide (TPR) repeat protein